MVCVCLSCALVATRAPGLAIQDEEDEIEVKTKISGFFVNNGKLEIEAPDQPE